MFTFIFVCLCLVSVDWTLAQDYEVADVQCYLGDIYGKNQRMVARLRKPENFRGHPVFADDLKVNPRNDIHCQIVPEIGDVSARIYRLIIDDFSRCGVTRHSGYIHVRVWFPLLPSAMTSQDQEVILVCKPPEATVLSSKTTALASTAPNQARVSGVVEESYSKLEYQVAVYRQVDERTQRAHSVPKVNNIALTGTSPLGYTNQQPYIIPLDEAVPIGTRLQLRATVNPDSAWRYAKLMEVSVSPDPRNPLAEGHIRLVTRGCRNPEMRGLMSRQPRRSPSKPTEVWMDFEAFLLAADYSARHRREGQQWIHTTVLACVDERDCRPDICSDTSDPAGFGRRRKRQSPFQSFPSFSGFSQNLSGNFQPEVRFEPVPIRVLVPQDGREYDASMLPCRMWIISSGILVSISFLCFVLMIITSYFFCRKKRQLEQLTIKPPPSGRPFNFQY